MDTLALEEMYAQDAEWFDNMIEESEAWGLAEVLRVAAETAYWKRKMNLVVAELAEGVVTVVDLTGSEEDVLKYYRRKRKMSIECRKRQRL